MISALCAVLLCPAAVAAPAPPVHASTGAAPGSGPLSVTTQTVADVYTGDSVRDPFLPPAMGGGGGKRVDKNGPLDIHSLHLRGILKDRASNFAIFATEAGQTLLLRGGRLYDGRNKKIPGITGQIDVKLKRVELITADKDVQVFTLGETEQDREKTAAP